MFHVGLDAEPAGLLCELNGTPALRAKIKDLLTEARDALEKHINGNGAKTEPKDNPMAPRMMATAVTRGV